MPKAFPVFRKTEAASRYPVLMEERARRRREKIAAAQEWAEGSLPDFVVIGAQKSGTSFFYRLLVGHPLVRQAAVKEVHFFDRQFAKGLGWYRRCFPQP